jgi:hypothetical protein
MKQFILPALVLIGAMSIKATTYKADLSPKPETNLSANQKITKTATLKSSSRLFKVKEDLTSVIQIIPSGSVVSVLGSDSTYLHVTFEENEGYIFKRHAVIDPEPINFSQLAKKKEVVQKEEPVQQKEISRFSYLEGKYGSKMAARLIAGKIWKKMTTEMIKDSWGSPQKINRVISGNVIQEEWIYNNTWLYVENNILEEWGPIIK